MSGGRRSAEARGKEGKQLTGWPACGNDVGNRLNDFRDDVNASRSGEQGNRWHDRMNGCCHRWGRRSTHYHRAVAAGFAEGRFRLAASSLEELPITAVRCGNTAARTESRTALLSLTIPGACRFRNQHRKQQRECSQYSDEAMFWHSESIPGESFAVKILRRR